MMIEKIREYLIDNKIIDNECRINIDFLGENPTEFAIAPIPIDPILKKYINGSSKRQFQFQLISCNNYGSDVLQNIENTQYYEKLCNIIEKNNKKKILPKIPGIKEIKCLNNGAILDATTNTARYAIQMQIIYSKGGKYE